MKNSKISNVIDEILHSQKRHNLIIASAGSGKTYTLTNVLAQKIKKGIINPLKEEIIVFTFTNKAAEELIVRISQLLGKDINILNRIYIGTIHGWCQKFLNLKGILSNTKVLDQLERTQLIERIYPLLGLNIAYEGRNKFIKIDKFEADLELFYNECFSLNDLVIPRNIRPCLQKYFEFINSQRLLDFGSLIRNSVDILLNTEKGIIKHHIFVDEYQDVNPSQVELIKSILRSHSKSTLFAVGDPRQTIYQWRGSDISRILHFEKDFCDTNHFTLKVNRRSRSGIVQYANIIANDMQFKPPIKIENMDTYPDRIDTNISVINYVGPEEHEKTIINLIKQSNSEGIPYGDMAILMRSVMPGKWTSESYAQILMGMLDEEEIPYYSPNKNSGTTFVMNFMDSILTLMMFMANDTPLGNREEENERSEEIEQNLKIISRYCKTNTNKIHIALAEWYNEISTIAKKDKKGNIHYNNENYNFRKQFFIFCKKIKFTIQPDNTELQEGFSAVTQIMRAIEEIYRRRFQGLSGFRSSPFEIFINNLNWHINHQIERWTEVGMNINGGNRVTISTIHAAKGLEWPMVFVPFLYDKKFPLRNSSHYTSFPEVITRRYGTTIEDEKRLWYVAVTRARDRLYFFSNYTRGKRRSSFSYDSAFNKGNPLFLKTLSIPKENILSVTKSYRAEHYYYLSLSDFLLLLECPYHFHLRKLKGIDVPVGQEFGAGNVVHKVIERLANNDPLSIKEIIDEEVYFPLAEYPQQETMKKSIKKKIDRLFSSGILDDIDNAEYQFTYPIDNLLVSGIVDATKKRDKAIEIFDWKSSIHDKYLIRYERQIQFYTLALRTLGHTVYSGSLYDLSQDNINSAIINVDISSNKIDKLLQLAKSNVNNIINGNPNPIPDKISCRICDVKNICPSCIWKA